MTKYAANAMLATKISFINEMANVCESLGADINDVRRGIGHDDPHRLSVPLPGVGYGGKLLFPRDIRQLLIHLANTAGLSADMMEAVDRVNDRQKQVLVGKIRKHYGDALKDKTLALWGLAFKPRTDDVRDAPRRWRRNRRC